MKDLNQENFTRQLNKVIAPGNKLLLAISGGVDSVVLCHLLLQSGITFQLAHVNYHLREKESDGDQHFIEKLAKKFKLKLHLLSVDTNTESKKRKTGIQETARDIRYQWMNDLLRKEKLNYIITAHHADDQAETIFFNFIRGTGHEGLAGIKPKEGHLIRPLLSFTKKQILSYAGVNKLKWREDSSNKKSEYSRNRIRNKIFSLIEEINPGFKSSVVSHAALYAEINKLVTEKLTADFEKAVRISEGDQSLGIDFLRAYPFQQLLLWHWLKPSGFTPEQVKNLPELFESQSGKRFENQEFVLLKDRNRIILHKKNSGSTEIISIDPDTKKIEEPIQLQIRTKQGKKVVPGKNPDKAVLDLDKLKFPLVLRKWKNGDHFRPLGMKGTKKISDFLIGQKIPTIRKSETYVLTSDGKIAWVVGHRVSADFAWTPASAKAYILEIL